MTGGWYASSDREGHYLLITTQGAMRDQADAALARLEAANGGQLPATLRDAYDVDPAAFALLIEALVNLGADVDDEMRELARIRPIDEQLQ